MLLGVSSLAGSFPVNQYTKKKKKKKKLQSQTTWLATLITDYYSYFVSGKKIPKVIESLLQLSTPGHTLNGEMREGEKVEKASFTN